MSGRPTKLPAEKERGGSAPVESKASRGSPKASVESPKASAVSLEKFDSALRHFLNRLPWYSKKF